MKLNLNTSSRFPNNMRFAHIADCHLGGWREPRMRDVSLNSFIKLISMIIEDKVDFVLISGDLFNTSHPSIDVLKLVVINLRKLKENNIPVYTIAGSHDFSPSGKTMIDVLEEAELLVNIVKGEIINDKLRLKFTTDKKTGVKIAGMLGKKGSLEKKYYEDLDRTSLESETGFKIFMFHTSIEELKPKSLEKMDAEPVSILPRKFDYYAGGHIHIVENKSFENHKNVVYPGPVYPNNFRELEELSQGSYVLYNDGEITPKKIPSKQLFILKINGNKKQAKQIEQEAIDELQKIELYDKIVLMRFSGKLLHSNTSDIDFSKIIRLAYERGAYFVMRNTFYLRGEEFEEVKIEEESVEKIEEKLIDEHIKNFKHGNVSIEKDDFKDLMNALTAEKMEGETNPEFEKRLIQDLDHVLNIE